MNKLAHAGQMTSLKSASASLSEDEGSGEQDFQPLVLTSRPHFICSNVGPGEEPYSLGGEALVGEILGGLSG